MNPDIDIERIKGQYFSKVLEDAKKDQLQKGYGADPLSGKEQGYDGYLGSKLPWVGAALDIGALVALKGHLDRIEDGTAKREDYAIAGRYLAELEKEEGKGSS